MIKERISFNYFLLERIPSLNFLVRKKLLIRTPSNTYYDPSYVAGFRRIDPLNRTLMQATADKSSPKSIEFNKFLREKKSKEQAFNRVLGKLKETDYDDLQREPEKDYEKIKQRENKEKRDELKGERKYNIKKNDPEAYTNPSGNQKKRFHGV